MTSEDALRVANAIHALATTIAGAFAISTLAIGFVLVAIYARNRDDK